MSTVGTIFDIEHGSFVDGPGIRTTVFFKGCNLRCAWCHNPESQNFAPEKLYYRDKCADCGRCRTVCPSPDACILCGKCADLCPGNAISICGREATADEVMSEIEKDAAFFGNDGGVTFSGGECMLQPDFLEELIARCRAQGISTAVDTAGHLPWETFLRIRPDLWLYDVKATDPEVHRAYTGVDNELILANLDRLLSSGARVWIRVPVIPGVNDSKEEMERIRDFVHGRAEKIELLPYHRLGENKYPALGRECKAFDVPDKADLCALKKIFEENM